MKRHMMEMIKLLVYPDQRIEVNRKDIRICAFLDSFEMALTYKLSALLGFSQGTINKCRTRHEEYLKGLHPNPPTMFFVARLAAESLSKHLWGVYVDVLIERGRHSHYLLEADYKKHAIAESAWNSWPEKEKFSKYEYKKLSKYDATHLKKLACMICPDHGDIGASYVLRELCGVSARLTHTIVSRPYKTMCKKEHMRILEKLHSLCAWVPVELPEEHKPRGVDLLVVKRKDEASYPAVADTFQHNPAKKPTKEDDDKVTATLLSNKYHADMHAHNAIELAVLYEHVNGLREAVVTAYDLHREFTSFSDMPQEVKNRIHKTIADTRATCLTKVKTRSE